MGKHKPQTPEQLRSLDFAAEYIGVKKKTIQNWIADGRLPYWEVHGIRMIDMADLMAGAVKYG